MIKLLPLARGSGKFEVYDAINLKPQNFLNYVRRIDRITRVSIRRIDNQVNFDIAQ